MSNKKTNNKINANAEVAKVLETNKIVPASVQAESSRPDWDREITPIPGVKDDAKFDFDRTDMSGAKTDGVRYAKIDDNGRVMQVRVIEGIERHWWTVKDAVDAGVLGEEYAKWTGHMTEYDAKIARVEIMESLGMDVPDGVAMAYAQGVKDKKDAIAKKEKRESDIVAAGKDAYQKDASEKAGKRFDKIEERVNSRQK